MEVSICYPTVTAPGVIKDAAPPCFLTQLQEMAVSPCSMVRDLSAYWLRLLLRLLESQAQVGSDLTSQASE